MKSAASTDEATSSVENSSRWISSRPWGLWATSRTGMLAERRKIQPMVSSALRGDRRGDGDRVERYVGLEPLGATHVRTEPERTRYPERRRLRDGRTQEDLVLRDHPHTNEREHGSRGKTHQVRGAEQAPG
jgi:hypothetical protein